MARIEVTKDDKDTIFTYKLVAEQQENPNLWLVYETTTNVNDEPSNTKITASGLTDLTNKIRSIVKPTKAEEETAEPVEDEPVEDEPVDNKPLPLPDPSNG